MSQSLAKIYVHVIFSTKHRVASLSPEICKELYPYTAEVLKSLDCPALMVGGVEDHIHILCLLSKSIKAEDLVGKIKTPTSAWLKRKGPAWKDFYWQGGYGVFSVSPSNVDRVKRYILNQVAHHQKESFQDEFRRFLKRYEIPYDERYVWD